ncbi:MAG: hypothetical protein IKC47_00875 [Clostridia bacterium]|nr:hypothetical protein [Clostridia bacterium]
MAKYKKCPRCELNYILSEEEMCEVCKAELGLESKLTLLGDLMDEEEQLKLCPVCKAAYIGMDETMCDICLANAEQDEIDEENDDEWRNYLDDDPDDLDDLDVGEDFGEDADFDDEEEEEMFDDEDFDDEDDFDDIDFDDEGFDDEDDEDDDF